jgi:hypothetical protein
VQISRVYLPVCYGDVFRHLIASPLRAPPVLK